MEEYVMNAKSFDECYDVTSQDMLRYLTIEDVQDTEWAEDLDEVTWDDVVDFADEAMGWIGVDFKRYIRKAGAFENQETLIRIEREIMVSDLDEIDYDQLGNCYSFYNGSANSYAGDKNKRYRVVIKGWVACQYVNWAISSARNAIWDFGENEINVDTGNPILVTSVTANRKVIFNGEMICHA